MSQELVPLSYARTAWNTYHGADLQGHDSLLNAEQAAQINRQYDIEVHGGFHGNKFVRPTQREYDEAAAVIDGMEPGDTLFIEKYGFRQQPPEPIPRVEAAPISETQVPDPYNRMLGTLAAFGISDEQGHSAQDELAEMARSELEALREDDKIDAWDYAESLAEIKGVRIVYADHDAFEQEGLKRVTGGRDRLGLVTGEQQDIELAGRVDASRDRTAVHTMKDWALEHPVPEGAETPHRKPKLVLLTGKDHLASVETVVDDMGLEATTHAMSVSTMEERMAEQKQKRASKQRQELGRVLVATQLPVATASPANRPPVLGAAQRLQTTASLRGRGLHKAEHGAAQRTNRYSRNRPARAA
jgi:hypothetical protein